MCDPQRVAAPEAVGETLTQPTADALRVTDPRSVGKARAPVTSASASISEFGLNWTSAGKCRRYATENARRRYCPLTARGFEGITFRHGQTCNHPDFARRIAPGALESAARLLGAAPPERGATSPRERSFRKGRQERDLESWARESGLWLDQPERVLEHLVRGGEEHRFWRGAHYYLKATYPGRYGFTIVAGQVYPGLAPALPGEYLERLQLSNAHFGDAVQLEGIAREDGALVIFTSQPTVVGQAADPEDIVAFMEHRRLQLLDGLALGHAGALCFYRDLDQLAVFDAHPANVLKDERGVILPIDLITLVAEDALAAQLGVALS